MIHKKFRLFTIWQHEKLEKWLNEMSIKGLQLSEVRDLGRYMFEDGGHGEYTYRITFLNYFNRRECNEYIALAEEMGVEYVGMTGWWGYFRKKTSDGAFELYSDNSSKLRHYRRIQTLTIIISIFCLHNLFNSAKLFLEIGDATRIAILFLHIIISFFLFKGFFSINNKIKKLKEDSRFRE